MKKRGSPTESSITTKGATHCLMMLYAEYPTLRGAQFVFLGEALN
jgi:hypothetical protein